MLSLVVLGLLLMGVVILFRYPSGIPYYYMVWFSLFIYIEGLVFRIDYSDVSFDKKTQLYYLIFSSIAVSVLKYKRLFRDDFLIRAFFLLCYIVLLAFLRGGGGFLFFMIQMVAFVPLWIIFNSTSSFSTNLFERIVRFFLILELVLGVIQIVFNVAYPSYTEREIRNGALNVVGTFSRYNVYAEQISLLSLSLLIISFYQTKKQMWLDWLLVGLGFVVVVMAGARTQLLAMMVSLTVILFYRMSNKWKLSFIVVMVSIFLLSQNISYGQSENVNINRQLELFKIYTDSKYLSQGATSHLSFYLLKEFTSSPETFLIGSGKLFTQTLGYGGLVMRGGVMYDSFLLLFLCETGIIGIILLTLCLYSILKKSRFNRNAMAILLFLLIVSVTDWGFFEGYSVIYLFFIIKYQNERNKDLQFHHSASQHSRDVEPVLGEYSAT